MFNIKTFVKFASLVFAGTLLFCFVSCEKPARWENDLSVAKNKAFEENKKIILAFTGYQWDSASVSFKERVIENKAFCKAAAEKYVLVNIDYDAEPMLFSGANVSEDIYDLGNLLETYAVNLSQMPCCYLLNDQGYVLQKIDCDPQLILRADDQSYTFADYFASRVQDAEESSTEVYLALEQIRSAYGIDKFLLADYFLDEVEDKYGLLYDQMVREQLQLDPYNQTGLLGKYELQMAYRDALRMAEKNDLDGIYMIFTDICNSGHLDAEQKQNAYYTAAMSLACMNSTDFDLIKELLQKSIDAAPESENAKTIALALNAAKQYAFVYSLEKKESQE